MTASMSCIRPSWKVTASATYGIHSAHLATTHLGKNGVVFGQFDMDLMATQDGTQDVVPPNQREIPREDQSHLHPCRGRREGAIRRPRRHAFFAQRLTV